MSHRGPADAPGDAAWGVRPAVPFPTGMAAARSRLGHDAEEWGVPRRAAEGLFVLPLVAAVVVGASRVHKGVFRVLTGEDGVLEWLQVVAYATGAVFACALAVRLFREGRRPEALLFLGLGLACAVVAGEEISWGQRILGLETPEALQDINKQGETTFHNIGVFQMLLNAVQLAFATAAAVAPWLLARRALARGNRILVPPLFLSSAFAVIAGFRALRFLDVPRSNFTIVEYGELPELCLAAAIAAYVALALRHHLGSWSIRWSVVPVAFGLLAVGGSAATTAASESPDIGDRGTLLGVVEATAETEPVPHANDAADDPAVWVHPADPAQSTVIGTDKQGGLAVYDLAGEELQYIEGGDPNNVDVRDGFVLGDRTVSLVAAGNRSTDTIGVYAVDPATRVLEDVSAGPLRLGIEVHGVCLYRSPVSGRFYFFGNSDEGRVEQWELFDRSGSVDARRVRTVRLDSEIEGCVADDEHEALYIGEEGAGVWRYGAEPSAGSERRRVDRAGLNARLVPDVEGLAIADGPDGTGFLVVSSQGNDSFAVYGRTDGNDYVGSIRVGEGEIDGVEATDGIEVTTRSLGPAFPEGALVVQDGDNGDENQNFKVIPWEAIADLLPRP